MGTQIPRLPYQPPVTDSEGYDERSVGRRTLPKAISLQASAGVRFMSFHHPCGDEDEMQKVGHVRILLDVYSQIDPKTIQWFRSMTLLSSIRISLFSIVIFTNSKGT